MLKINKNNLIILASWKGHAKIVEILINKGINVHIPNDDGRVALYYGLYKIKLK